MFDQFEAYSVRKTLERGIEQGIEAIVKNMLLEEASIDFILKVSKLPLEQIMVLKEELERIGENK